jgi:hypothetical protein
MSGVMDAVAFEANQNLINFLYMVIPMRRLRKSPCENDDAITHTRLSMCDDVVKLVLRMLLKERRWNLYVLQR